MTTDNDDWPDPSIATDPPSPRERVSPAGFAMLGALGNIGAILVFLAVGSDGAVIALGLFTAACIAGALGEGLARMPGNDDPTQRRR